MCSLLATSEYVLVSVQLRVFEHLSILSKVLSNGHVAALTSSHLQYAALGIVKSGGGELCVLKSLNFQNVEESYTDALNLSIIICMPVPLHIKFRPINKYR